MLVLHKMTTNQVEQSGRGWARQEPGRTPTEKPTAGSSCLRGPTHTQFQSGLGVEVVLISDQQRQVI